MNPQEQIAKLEETRNEVIRFTNELDEKLKANELDGIQYYVLLNEKLGGKNKEEIIGYLDSEIETHRIGAKKSEESQKRNRTMVFSAAAAIILLMIGISIFYNNPGITGYTTALREVQESVAYNQVFDTYTETQLSLDKITSLKISGTLEGTKAVVKLRIGGVDYAVAEVVKPQDAGLITGMIAVEEQPIYTLATDRESYAPGETVTLALTPESDNKSLYISHGEEMQKLEQGNYTPTEAGEYQAIAIITLENDIIRAEANFTVVEQMIAEEPVPINQTVNETNETNDVIVPPEQPATAYDFTALCLDTCNLPETTNPILIVEVDPGSKLTITSITTAQNKENEAPVQERNMPDITLAPGQTAEIDLNEHFTDPDGDVVQYDLNEIAEISSVITQNLLVLSGTTPGVYTAYIYATDGDKLTTSNTFQITITSSGMAETNDTANMTGNETEPAPVTPIEAADPCSNPDPNQRPLSCMEGKEEQYFVMESIFLQDSSKGISARITPLGNLIIEGIIIESSTATPASGDFMVTAFNDNYDLVPVAWIDSTTRDLYLKGKLYEEDFFLEPTPNAFVIQNKRNINLAYIDRQTGDLHIKGNLIQNKVKLS